MLRLLFCTVVLGALAAPPALVYAALEPEPALERSAAPSPQEARSSRMLALRLHAAATGQGPAEVQVSADEIDGLFATAARALPDLRGRAEIGDDGVRMSMSLRPPALADLGWINLDLEVAPSDRGLDLRRLTVGPLALPPELTVAVLRRLADFAADEPVGTLMLGAVERVATTPGRVALTLDPREGAQDPEAPGVYERVTGSLRRLMGAQERPRVGVHYLAMLAASKDGRLPRSGSTASWMAFAVESARGVVAAEHLGPDAAEAEMEAAILALAAHCGARWAIESAVGDMPAPPLRSRCVDTRLLERDDLRKHFVLSAALEAAGDSTVSFGLGEVKELDDASGGGSGFSFDDVAADRAGIRWSQAVRAAARAGDAAMAEAARLSAEEEAVMPSIRDLPSFLERPRFESLYGEVDSPAYRRQLAEIDARIDALPLHDR